MGHLYYTTLTHCLSRTVNKKSAELISAAGYLTFLQRSIIIKKKILRFTGEGMVLRKLKFKKILREPLKPGHEQISYMTYIRCKAPNRSNTVCISRFGNATDDISHRNLP